MMSGNRYFEAESHESYPRLAKKEKRTKSDKGKEKVEKGKTKEDAIVLD